MRYKVLFLLILIALCACQKHTLYQPLNLTSKPSFLDEGTLIAQPDIPSIDQVIKLSIEQQKDFLNSFHNDSDSLPSRRVFNYLSTHLERFNYYSETVTASQALSKNTGNCLTLALLTKSLADLAGIGIRYEMVRTQPVYQRTEEVILSSQHIRAVLYNVPIEKGIIPSSVSKSITIDYYPTQGTETLRWVEEQEFFSLFYTNKAAELLAKNDVETAYWYLKEALEVKPSNVQAINMMGVVYGQLDFNSEAEQWYLYGLNFQQYQFDLLNNYYLLLKRLQRDEEAQQIAKQLSQYKTDNPFDWVALGDDAYESAQYKAAIRYYKKASRMAKYLHEPYAGIARSYYQLGNKKSAQKAIKKALENAHQAETLTVYQAKYETLSRQLNEQ